MRTVRGLFLILVLGGLMLAFLLSSGCKGRSESGLQVDSLRATEQGVYALAKRERSSEHFHLITVNGPFQVFREIDETEWFLVHWTTRGWAHGLAPDVRPIRLTNLSAEEGPQLVIDRNGDPGLLVRDTRDWVDHDLCHASYYGWGRGASRPSLRGHATWDRIPTNSQNGAYLAYAGEMWKHPDPFKADILNATDLQSVLDAPGRSRLSQAMSKINAITIQITDDGRYVVGSMTKGLFEELYIWYDVAQGMSGVMSGMPSRCRFISHDGALWALNMSWHEDGGVSLSLRDVHGQVMMTRELAGGAQVTWDSPRGRIVLVEHGSRIPDAKERMEHSATMRVEYLDLTGASLGSVDVALPDLSDH
jgi:hypothetical protein